MNDERRKILREIVVKLDDARSNLEVVRDDEQEAFDNLPEGMQQGDKGQKAEAAIEALNEAIDNVENVVTCIDTASE